MPGLVDRGLSNRLSQPNISHSGNHSLVTAIIAKALDDIREVAKQRKRCPSAKLYYPASNEPFRKGKEELFFFGDGERSLSTWLRLSYPESAEYIEEGIRREVNKLGILTDRKDFKQEESQKLADTEVVKKQGKKRLDEPRYDNGVIKRKRCRRCLKLKKYSEFKKRTNSHLENYCKPCSAKLSWIASKKKANVS